MPSTEAPRTLPRQLLSIFAKGFLQIKNLDSLTAPAWVCPEMPWLFLLQDATRLDVRSPGEADSTTAGLDYNTVNS